MSEMYTRFLFRIKKTSNDQEFNFWEMFIDVGDLKNEGEINIIY